MAPFTITAYPHGSAVQLSAVRAGMARCDELRAAIVAALAHPTLPYHHRAGFNCGLSLAAGRAEDSAQAAESLSRRPARLLAALQAEALSLQETLAAAEAEVVTEAT